MRSSFERRLEYGMIDGLENHKLGKSEREAGMDLNEEET